MFAGIVKTTEMKNLINKARYNFICAIALIAFSAFCFLTLALFCYILALSIRMSL